MNKAALGFMQHEDDIHVMQFGILTAFFFLILQALAVLLLFVGTDAAVDNSPPTSIDFSACLMLNTSNTVVGVVDIQ